jgi:hypothetical protein
MRCGTYPANLLELVSDGYMKNCREIHSVTNLLSIGEHRIVSYYTVFVRIMMMANGTAIGGMAKRAATRPSAG